MVVISSAVRRDNPEVQEAARRKIPVIPRAAMLAELMRLKYGVAIAGSHGKTTTTSLAAHLLAHAGLDPTAVVGGKVNGFGSNAKLGKGDYMVVEADESDGSFLRLTPTIAIVTNIDPEHLDHWKTPEALRQGFVDFVNRVPFYGSAILCIDHPTVQSNPPRRRGAGRHLRRGAHAADYRAEGIEVSGHAVRFDAFRREEPLGRFEVAMVGRHNALNALAVIALGDEMGIPPDVTRTALASFQGVQRRFTVRGEAAGVTVVDDYGHHPAEVRATLQRRAPGLPAAGGVPVPAAPLHAHARPVGRVRHRLQRRRRGAPHRHLRRRRGPHPRRDRRPPGRGHPRLRPPRRDPGAPGRAGPGGAASGCGPGIWCSPWARATSTAVGTGAAGAPGAVVIAWRDEIERRVHGQLMRDAPLAARTAIRVGGPADLLVRPADPDALGELLRAVRGLGVPFSVLGGGANTLVADAGVRGVVLKLPQDFPGESVEGERLVLAGGAPSARLPRAPTPTGSPAWSSSPASPGRWVAPWP